MSDPEHGFICPICFEIYIEPVVVGCGHMFCKFCIKQWACRINKCPICQLDINRVVILTNGNAIMDLVNSFLSNDARSRRVTAIKQREIDRTKRRDSKKIIQAQSAATSPPESLPQGHDQHGANFNQHNTASRSSHNSHQRYRWWPF